MSEIIMFAGGIGSGKAYQMNKIVTNLKETGNSIAMISFADPIKKIVKDIYGVDKRGQILSRNHPNDDYQAMTQILTEISKYVHISDLAKEKIFNSSFYTFFAFAHNDLTHSKETNDIDNLIIAIRKMMQIVGTEVGHSIKKTIWPDITFDTAKKLINDMAIDYVIIDDLRFLFELIVAPIRLPSQYKITPYYIEASKETRAKRRNISLEQLELESQHSSERESLEVLLPFMRLYYSNNIINGENE